MDIVFYSFDEMRTKPKSRGAVLLRALSQTAPDTFTDAHDYLHVPQFFRECNDTISGLLVQKQGRVPQCILVLKEAKVDRIYTLPRFRKRGYAKQMLVLLRAASMMGQFSFISPVEPEVVPVFLAAGWTRGSVRTNPDGTLDMMAHEICWAPMMDIGLWATMLGQFSTE